MVHIQRTVGTCARGQQRTPSADEREEFLSFTAGTNKVSRSVTECDRKNHIQHLDNLDIRFLNMYRYFY